MDIKYKIFDPSGNITALVEGDHFTPEERIVINDAIMAKHVVKTNRSSSFFISFSVIVVY